MIDVHVNVLAAILKGWFISRIHDWPLKNYIQRIVFNFYLFMKNLISNMNYAKFDTEFFWFFQPWNLFLLKGFNPGKMSNFHGAFSTLKRVKIGERSISSRLQLTLSGRINFSSHGWFKNLILQRRYDPLPPQHLYFPESFFAALSGAIN